MRFRVKYLDGSETEVVRTASALRAFELKNNTSVLDAIRTGRSWWADEIAHSSLAQTEGAEPDFDIWLDTVETISWGMPESQLLQVAEAIGVHIEPSAPEDPTGAEQEPSQVS